MKYGDFIREVWSSLPESNKLKQEDVKNIVQSVFEVVADQVKSGNSIKIRNFGTFKQKTLAARNMRMPKTGEIKKLPERKKIAFIAGAKLKASLGS